MKLFSSFRAQMVFFVAAMLLITTVALQLINQYLERQITTSAEEQFYEVTKAVDIALNSFPTGQYLNKLAQSEGLSVDSQNTIHNITITNEQGAVIDSTDEQDIDNKLRPEIASLPPMRHNETLLNSLSTEHISKIQFPITTDKGTRSIIVVVSLQRLSQTVSQVGRIRLFATIALGLILLLITALISRSFTRPVTELAKAAQRVTAGDLGFQVKITQRNEVSTLSQTFNEMIAGLRRNKELEEQLQRSERSAVVGRLASGIAHEIRNPLNFMNLSIDHLQAKFILPPKSNHEAEATRHEAVNILGLIKDEIARLNRLVSDFLSYGRPARLKFRALDARQLLEEVIGLVHTQAEQQGINISLQMAENTDPNFEVDPEQIKTCFSNLIINAVQAMPEGGDLLITVTNDETELQFEFRDTGCGIAAETLEQIFEPYYSTKETGIGLGLPLTKKLIEDHSGEIKVSSEVGSGTIFTVSLPRQAIQKSENVQAN